MTYFERDLHLMKGKRSKQNKELGDTNADVEVINRITIKMLNVHNTASYTSLNHIQFSGYKNAVNIIFHVSGSNLLNQILADDGRSSWLSSNVRIFKITTSIAHTMNIAMNTSKCVVLCRNLVPGA